MVEELVLYPEKGSSLSLRRRAETSSWGHLISSPICTGGCCLCRFLPIAPGTNWIAVWVDPRSVRDAWQWTTRQAEYVTLRRVSASIVAVE